jgi:tellurite resistance protein
VPATVSAAATPAGDDSATIEVMEGLMTELDLARDFGDRATREVIERLKTELDLARAFFSHNERK